jgi:hypothetical protein
MTPQEIGFLFFCSKKGGVSQETPPLALTI